MSDHPSEASATAQPPVHPVHTVTVPPEVAMVSLLGPRDELLRTMERQFPKVEIAVRGNEFRMVGPSADVALVERLIDELLVVIGAGQPLNRDAVERSIGMLRSQTTQRPADVLTMNIVSNRGRTIRPKTLNQKTYVDAIDRHTIVFGIGPAGTGKTYLAMAKAVAALQAKQVNRIILTRPAVEAGERLGFLPGTLNDKIDPYLRPLYDALHDMVDPESIPRLMAAGTVEVAPLAYMRGRAQPLDAQVLTPDGFRRLGDLQVGDLVTGSNGAPTPVIGVFPQGRKPVYRVTTQDGASTLACGEHLWTVRTPDDAGRGRWRTIRTLDMIGRLRQGLVHQFELPLVEAVEFTPSPVPVGPKALGPEGTHPATAFVPEPDKYSRPSERRAVLAGLLAPHGTAVEHGERRGAIEYTTSSTRLRDDVIFLVRSLGGVASSRIHPGHGGMFVIDIRLPGEGGRPMRYIESIEPAGEAETRCIQVAAADSLYVTDDFLVTHNTLNDAFIILDEAQNTSGEQMKMFLTRLGFGSKIVVTGDVTQVDLPGGTQSGLKVVQDILHDIDDVHFSYLTSVDVVRHRLVGDIVEAYGRWDSHQHRPAAQRGGARNEGRR